MPSIPIPLAPGDDELPLALRSLFTTTCDRTGYDHSLDDHARVVPPLVETDRERAAEILARRRERA